MKLLRSNGRELTVRDVGPVIFRLTTERGGLPLPCHDAILEDDETKNILRDLLATGRYNGGKVVVERENET